MKCLVICRCLIVFFVLFYGLLLIYHVGAALRYIVFCTTRGFASCRKHRGEVINISVAKWSFLLMQQLLQRRCLIFKQVFIEVIFLSDLKRIYCQIELYDSGRKYKLVYHWHDFMRTILLIGQIFKIEFSRQSLFVQGNKRISKLFSINCRIFLQSTL